MDWHNFKVMSVYAVVLCVILFIIGQSGLAIIALVGYSMYGLIDCIKQYNKKRKIDNDLEGISENIKEITICHITKRNPKLKKSVEQRIKKDIANGNYQINTFQLVDKISIADDEPDGGSDYYLTFDNNDKYHVYRIVYDNAHIGDTLYIITTPTDVIKVIRSKTEYFNLFTY